MTSFDDTTSLSSRTLVLDCATEACSVALFEGGTCIAGEMRMLGRGHAEALVPMIAALPHRGKAGRIAVSLGPGSFTGVRVGLAAARALALAWQAEILGFPTLALVAAMAGEAEGEQPLAVAMTGGHGEWFVQRFAADGSSAPGLVSMRPDTASADVTEHLVAGTQAEALVAARGQGRALPLWPDARHFHLLARDTLTLDIRPIYGRPPDAKIPVRT